MSIAWWSFSNDQHVFNKSNAKLSNTSWWLVSDIQTVFTKVISFVCSTSNKEFEMGYPFHEPQNHNKYIIRLQTGSVWMVAQRQKYVILCWSRMENEGASLKPTSFSTLLLTFYSVFWFVSFLPWLGSRALLPCPNMHSFRMRVYRGPLEVSSSYNRASTMASWRSCRRPIQT